MGNTKTLPVERDYYSLLVKAIAENNISLAQNILSYDKLTLKQLEKILAKCLGNNNVDNQQICSMLTRLIINKRNLIQFCGEKVEEEVEEDAEEKEEEVINNNHNVVFMEEDKEVVNYKYNITLMQAIKMCNLDAATDIMENDILTPKYLYSCLKEIDKMKGKGPGTRTRMKIRWMLITQLNKMYKSTGGAKNNMVEY